MTSQPEDGYGRSSGVYGPRPYQLRQPRGIPAGGQFAPKQNTESTLVLDEAQGSFYFPAVCRTPEELIEFWSEVRIPDEVLERFRGGYNYRRAGWFKAEVARRSGERMAEWDHQYPEPEKKRFGPKEPYEEWVSRRKQAWKEIQASVSAEVDNERPAVMAASNVRPFVRATQMYHYIRPSWSDEQKQLVLDHEIELSYGTRLVANIEKGWRFSELSHLLDETGEDELRRQERIRQQQHEELVEQLKDLEFEIKNLQKIQGIIAGYEK